MNRLLIGLVGALLATNLPAAGGNAPAKTMEAAPAAVDPNDSVEKEYKKLLSDDDQAQEEADRMIQDNEKFATNGAGLSPTELAKHVRDRFEPVRQAYEDFLRRHPEHARARVAYASFLGDIHDDDGAEEQLEKALPLDPKNPAIYNNLANLYGHHGPVKKAFEYYEKAIQLNPLEPIYYQNFGTTVYLFRTDVKEYYGITEQQVFDKALDLYAKARKLAPDDFPLASDVAQTYYGIQPHRTEDALRAWTNALNLAHDEIEREGVYIHLARIKYQWAGHLAEARTHLNAVTNAMYTDLKNRLSRNINQAEAAARGTNATQPKPQ